MANDVIQLSPETAEEWTTTSGISPETFSECRADIVCTLTEFIEQGTPVSIALEMAGVSENIYRDWVVAAMKGTPPFTWALTMLNKARATYIYDQILNLNTAEGMSYRKYMEILKLRDGANWGGDGGLDTSDLDFDDEFL